MNDLIHKLQSQAAELVGDLSKTSFTLHKQLENLEQFSLSNSEHKNKLKQLKQSLADAKITLADGREIYAWEHAAIEKLADDNGISSKELFATVTLEEGFVIGGNLSCQGISDISALAGLTKLRLLNLSESKIEDISTLTRLAKLKVLWLYDSQLTDISALAELTNLQVLRLKGNQIKDISALAGLTNLQKLWLPKNQLTDISDLAGLSNLQKLDLGYNQIKDISALAGLTTLQELKLFHNHIKDISDLAGLTNLQELWLGENPISASSKKIIKQLVSNGVNVIYE